MNNFEEIKKEIERLMTNSVIKTDAQHSQTTLKWLLKLKPDADEALQIAALGHDIERGFHGANRINEGQWGDKYSNYEEYKQAHANESGRIIAELLKKYNFDEKFIQLVKTLVEKHEVGGDEDANYLMDADSLSFFDSNFDPYLVNHGKENGKFKIEYMYNRMMDRAKEIGKELYKKCLEKIKI
ncbi:MAG: DUF4202 family protein [Candidatus Magasanikbacteria bacterium]